MEKHKSQPLYPKWHELPLGSDIIYPGSSRRLRTGQWRTERPVWEYLGENTGCIQCGVCVIFCPEGCIKMKPLKETSYDLSKLKQGLRLTGESLVPVVDYDYCKGCGICAKECWTGCIKMVPEEEVKNG